MIMEPTRLWCGVEFDKTTGELFKEFLRTWNITFEPSEAGSLVHFEVCVNEVELDMINSWIDDIFKEGEQKDGQ